jgi:hypothetical protein
LFRRLNFQKGNEQDRRWKEKGSRKWKRKKNSLKKKNSKRRRRRRNPPRTFRPPYRAGEKCLPRDEEERCSGHAYPRLLQKKRSSPI